MLVGIVIRFNRNQCDIENVIEISSDITKFLIHEFHQKDKTIKGRLVARVCYSRLSTDEEVTYYHPSYRSEVIEDAENFFITHMMKIAQRMDDFNRNGSNLIINNISEIHLHVACLN